MVMLDRGDYWQCAYVIPKGGIEEVKARGLDAFRKQVVFMSPFLADRVGELQSFDDIKLLSVAVDRLPRWWRPGLLCIGDAAHAMSPIGGVGINLAVQDAVAAANILWQPLLSGQVGETELRRVQERRELPTRMVQRAQVLIQERVITGVLGNRDEIKPPLAVKLLHAFPILRRIPARLLGMGIRPEHIRTPEKAAPA
jgi:2-polyprenyl-6-methoxyphenol hydroxylase-like FAD-dependent oxidoreductase